MGRQTATQLALAKLLRAGVLEEWDARESGDHRLYFIRHDLAAQTGAPATPTIGFDKAARKFTGVTQGDVTMWTEAYPAIDIITELKQAVIWLIANPANRKSNYARFIANWLKRAQDRAPRVVAAGSALVPRNGAEAREMGRHIAAKTISDGSPDEAVV